MCKSRLNSKQLRNVVRQFTKDARIVPLFHSDYCIIPLCTVHLLEVCSWLRLLLRIETDFRLSVGMVTQKFHYAFFRGTFRSTHGSLGCPGCLCFVTLLSDLASIIMLFKSSQVIVFANVANSFLTRVRRRWRIRKKIHLKSGAPGFMAVRNIQDGRRR